MKWVFSRRLSRSFWALNISQFLGAMNDNVFRYIMMLALVARASDPAKGPLDETALSIAGVVFALPFILFSNAGGVLADRFSKRRIIVLCNFAEVMVMALGLFAFLSDSPFLIYTVLFLMASQSAFFGPNKLGVIPELVGPDKISFANGIMGGFTYLAIIFGTIGGSKLYAWFGAPDAASHPSTVPVWRASIFCISFAALGYGVSLLIRPTAPRASLKHTTPLFWKAVSRNMKKALAQDRYVFLSILAIAFFLFLGGFVQLNVVPYGVDSLGMAKASAALLFLAVALGIGIGSVVAGHMSGRNVEIGLVPFGSILVSASLLLFAIPIHHISYTIFLLTLLGIGGGFYIVPLNAFLQQEAPDDDRGEFIATSSVLSFTGLAIASGLFFALGAIGVPPSWRFFILGLITLGLSVYVVLILPDFLVRFLGLVVTRLAYNLEIRGLENMPLKGGALLVCNHVSYADAALLMATQQRRIRFLMDRSIYEGWSVSWLFRLMQGIPISRGDKPKELVRSFQQARQALDDGYLVCIFAEGSLTRTGYIQEFRKGVERIVKGTDYKVIPTNLHGIWGSILSYSDGKVLGRWPRPLRRRVTISIGEPMPSETSAFQMRQAVMELQSAAFEREKKHYRLLPLEFAEMARSRWGAFCIADSTGARLTYGRTLTSALALAAALREPLNGQERVGILLPSSVGGALANLAVSFLGKVPVNLNYTASAEAVRSAIEQCGITRIVTSKQFMKRLEQYADLPGLLYLEDCRKEITSWRKIHAYLKARFRPLSLLILPEWQERRPRLRSVDDTATIIFTSGSTGTPKGVVLSHYNIRANVESCRQIFRIVHNDVICGVLPFFHSFGYTVTLWMPLITGCAAAYHYNPMEAETVGKITRRHNVTIILGTPTFLMTYARKIKADRFTSVRIAVCGAEKMKPRIAETFEEKFGLVPLEGYGCTELSPVAAVNMPDVKAAGVHQKAHKPGSIGRPIPGVTMRIVDPDDLDRALGYGEEGMLLVKGPNVMKGYLNAPELTAEVMHGEWYVTGDVAKIEHDGFVTITDRLSRFSKIGGEMVPHQGVEDKILEILDNPTETVCVVTSVPHEKKGEALAVLLKEGAADIDALYQSLRGSDLPNLWVPPRGNFFETEEIPLLGSGKLDLKKVRTMAAELAGRKSV